MFYRYFFAIIFLMIVAFVCSTGARAQTPDYPVEGQMCPAFSLQKVEYYKKKSASLTDFRGKWLILYFWADGCPAAVQGFKRMNEIQSTFSDRLQVMLIANNDERNKNTRELYEKFRKQYNYRLSIAYDERLFRRFVGKAAIPHVVILRPDGIVHAVTFVDISFSQSIADLLAGKQVKFQPKYNAYNAQIKPFFYRNKPLRIDGNGGESTDFLYRSLLSKADTNYHYSLTRTLREQISKGQFQVMGASLLDLYKYAYLGTIRWSMGDSLYHLLSPKVEVEIQSLNSIDSCRIFGKGCYDYSLIVPKERATEDFVMQFMQRDLMNYFGYEATVEVREMPYWKLVVSDPKKLKYAIDAKDSVYLDHATLKIFSGKPRHLLGTIDVYNTTDALLDSTGITRNIRIDIDGDLSNLEHVRKEIRKNGLNLVRDLLPMKVLVLRDMPH